MNGGRQDKLVREMGKVELKIKSSIPVISSSYPHKNDPHKEKVLSKNTIIFEINYF